MATRITYHKEDGTLLLDTLIVEGSDHDYRDRTASLSGVSDYHHYILGHESDKPLSAMKKYDFRWTWYMVNGKNEIIEKSAISSDEDRLMEYQGPFDMVAARIEKNTPLFDVLSQNGRIVDVGVKRYMFLPYWYEHSYRSGKGDLIVHNLSNPPEELKEAIKEHRL